MRSQGYPGRRCYQGQHYIDQVEALVRQHRPRGGMVLCKRQFARAIDEAVFPAPGLTYPVA